jgi:hypothetical protein
LSDPLEDAAKTTELLFQEALRNRARVPEKTGFCLGCEEPTEGAFCSPECREDYEKLSKLRAIKGH